MARRKSTKHKGARKSTGGAVSISHAARQALHDKGLKICHRKKPSAYNKRVGACMRGKGGSPSAFKQCAKSAAGRASAPRRKSGGRKKASSSGGNYVRDAFSMW